jgi:succinylglutamic semialdehyde dehydrogenase
MPAVLAGNAVLFKPSELTPRVGELMAEIWHNAGIPPGLFNLVQGGPDAGSALTTHPDVDGILFTGSYAAGSAIHRALAGHPEKMLALEMGGNNPLIVWDCADLDAAAYTIIQSAYLTSGQRCTCARRLIIQRGTRLVDHLIKMISRIRVGLYTDTPEPFMGTVITPAAAQKLLKSQAELKGRTILEMKPDARSPSLLHPGLIDMTGVNSPDEELFGPLLRLIEVLDFDAAIIEANRTRYGLAAGLISDRPELCELFHRRVRAGVLSINRPTTGARSDLPFGGVGLSGNHRPSALFAADYCSDPVASVQVPRVALPEKLSPGINPP